MTRARAPGITLPREVAELTSSAELAAEGRALLHCIAEYAFDCRMGRSRVWSLRRRDRVDAPPRSVLTVELDPARRAVREVRGRSNRLPRAEPLRVLRAWAARERIALQ